MSTHALVPLLALLLAPTTVLSTPTPYAFPASPPSTFLSQKRTTSSMADIQALRVIQQAAIDAFQASNSTDYSSTSNSTNLDSDDVATVQVAATTESGLDGWHVDMIYTLVMEELDPIVSPNGQATHMHNVFGGNNFAAGYSYEATQESTCSTVWNQKDFSNYWMPQLYWINHVGQSDQSFTSVPPFIRFYYFLGRNDKNTPVEPFPEGLRMLIGDPNAKAANPMNMYFNCHVNADFSGDIVRNDFNFERDCPYGMKTEITFPSCWDGYNLYKDDMSHMSYPNQAPRSGACPWTHPIRLPAIMIEFTWHTEKIDAGKTLSGNLAWASGDTTGGGIHADFVNGWDTEVLREALNSPDCVNLGRAIGMEYCPVMAKYMNSTTAYNCMPRYGELVEPYGNAGDAVPAMPGCNPVWGNTTTKPDCSPAVPALDVSAFKATDGPYVVNATSQQNMSLPTENAWTRVGCFADIASVAPLWPTNATTYEYKDSKNSVARCSEACELNGTPFMALEMVGTNYMCRCSSAFNTGAGIVPTLCDTTCPGNSSDDCGGQYIANLYYKAPAELKSYSDSALSFIGCYEDPGTDGFMESAGYSFDSAKMNTTVCQSSCTSSNYRYSGISGSSCYCSNTVPLGTAKFYPNTSCSTKCAGNSTQTCGGANGLVSLFNNDVKTSSGGASRSLWLWSSSGAMLAATALVFSSLV